MRTCRVCGRDKDILDFRDSRKAGKKSMCDECFYGNSVRYEPVSDDVRAKQYDGYRKRQVEKYGITVDEFDEMNRQQGGVCWICHLPPEGRYLAIDHDHDTGEVRGLLCHPCNIGLGMFKDDVLRLERAILYLKRSI